VSSSSLRLVHELVRVGDHELGLLRPSEPEALLDEEAFEHDEFLPYWAELWPAGLAVARALPPRLDGMRVLEIGCGLGVPSLVAARRGADVVATDWAGDAVALLRWNATSNGIRLKAERVAWRDLKGRFELVLAADVLYERRNVDQLLEVLPRLTPRVLLGLAGRPHEAEFLRQAHAGWLVEDVAERVARLSRS
jgi:predicted nicotinamide N-methyase